jgi:sugar phosphate isomerase/epimerase
MRLIGRGDLNFDDYLRTLAEIGYVDSLTIEREIPMDPARQKAEIAAAMWPAIENLIRAL